MIQSQVEWGLGQPDLVGREVSLPVAVIGTG